MRFTYLMVGAVIAVAVVTAGCAGNRRSPLRTPASGSASDDGLAPKSQPTAQAVPKACEPKPTCLVPPNPPCPAPCPDACASPCEPCRCDWHVRGLGGVAFWAGSDAGKECAYLGADLGRSLCNSCWSVDAFWRTQTAHFPRDPSGEDGGTWNHVGLKASYERPIGDGRWFAWGGAGPEYFWTSDYVNDDSGVGVFGDAGVGYIVNSRIRVRAGVDVHGMNTDVGRRSADDDGNSRWLWVVAPVIGLEFDF